MRVGRIKRQHKWLAFYKELLAHFQETLFQAASVPYLKMVNDWVDCPAQGEYLGNWVIIKTALSKYDAWVPLLSKLTLRQDLASWRAT